MVRHVKFSRYSYSGTRFAIFFLPERFFFFCDFLCDFLCVVFCTPSPYTRKNLLPINFGTKIFLDKIVSSTSLFLPIAYCNKSRLPYGLVRKFFSPFFFFFFFFFFLGRERINSTPYCYFSLFFFLNLDDRYLSNYMFINTFYLNCSDCC